MSGHLQIQPFSNQVQGSIQIPGSKSLTNRALILAALANGKTLLEGCLFSEDTEIMSDALSRLGIKVQRDKEKRTIEVTGNGANFKVKEAELFVGNAGTTARFLTAMLCLFAGGTYRLDGTPAMRKRPMQGLLLTLRKLGAQITFHGEEGHFPFTLETMGLPGGIWDVDASQSSQILSALLIAAPLAREAVQLKLTGETVSKPFVKMTVDMMKDFGAKISGDGLSTTIIEPIESYAAKASLQIEPDATAASYFMMLPGLVGGHVKLPGLNQTMLQGDIGFEAVLREIGMNLEFSNGSMMSSSTKLKLQGGNFDFNPISDTFLTMAAAAPLLKGPTHIYGIAHTRKQETDRVHAMATELRKLGQRVDETEDSLRITPDLSALRAKAVKKPEIETYSDHRVAMSFGILGSYDLLDDGSPWLKILDPNCCAKTFPDFFEKLEVLLQASLHS